MNPAQSAQHCVAPGCYFIVSSIMRKAENQREWRWWTMWLVMWQRSLCLNWSKSQIFCKNSPTHPTLCNWRNLCTDKTLQHRLHPYRPNPAVSVVRYGGTNKWSQNPTLIIRSSATQWGPPLISVMVPAYSQLVKILFIRATSRSISNSANQTRQTVSGGKLQKYWHTPTRVKKVECSANVWHTGLVVDITVRLLYLFLFNIWFILRESCRGFGSLIEVFNKFCLKSRRLMLACRISMAARKREKKTLPCFVNGMHLALVSGQPGLLDTQHT